VRIGRIIGGLAAGGVAVFGATGAFEDKTTRNDAGEITEAGGVGAFVIKVGDCVNMPTEDIVTSLEGLPCADPHDAQVFDEFQMVGETYPVADALETEARDGCLWRWSAAIGANFDDMPDYDLTYFTPSPESWDTGDREVSCIIVRTDGAKMTASMLGAGATTAPPASDPV
jgi:hypothetical protein